MDDARHPVISDFLEYIKNVRRYSSHTIRAYSHDLDDYYSFCRSFDTEREFIDLDHIAIQSYLQQLSHQGLSAKTLARRLASIKSLYKYMLISNLVEVNIARLVKTPKIDRALPHYLSLKEAKDILQLPIGNDEIDLGGVELSQRFAAVYCRIDIVEAELFKPALPR